MHMTTSTLDQKSKWHINLCHGPQPSFLFAEDCPSQSQIKIQSREVSHAFGD